MEDADLKAMWQSLARENIIDGKLAENQILEIITKKGKGVISKLQKKHRLDFKVYLTIAMLIPVVMLFVLYRKNYGTSPQNLFDLQGHYLVPILMEAFLVYVLIRVRRNLKFLAQTFNTGTLKQSLVNVRYYFINLSREGFWIGTISLTLILVVYEINLIISIGGIQQLNYSFQGSHILESWIFAFILILIAGIPLMVKSDANKYKPLLDDLDQALKDLSTEDD